MCSEFLAANIVFVVDMISRLVNAHKYVKVYYSQPIPHYCFCPLLGLLQADAFQKKINRKINRRFRANAQK
jgi:hypothetical protein